ncbi:hypothetical protein E4S40_09760 [Algoriphagus kandeliae]|uniref:Thioredoxin domain-containing protein n=1 Tax=Algoriphagus kandeliae TaxID=2562278 RepID=A0A4Y9QQ36_9BACT|nr:hypothetical protein [Algoriphagus kandeliae]TFV94310.1 hypothetical protein E4S40_09760 [Algoriphagus kandeliae]
MISFLKICCFFVFLFGPVFSVAQTGYKDELGREISRDFFEQQILEGPYFGIPDGEGGKMLVHRMPVGLVDDPRIFFEKTGQLKAFQEGKMLLVIYYPGKDECNSSGLGNNASSFQKEHETLLKWANKYEATEPIYIYLEPSGLEKYQGYIPWREDPDDIFRNQFFKYPYPCGSFVVLHPSGSFRGILGGYPLSQINVALKKLAKN